MGKKDFKKVPVLLPGKRLHHQVTVQPVHIFLRRCFTAAHFLHQHFHHISFRGFLPCNAYGLIAEYGILHILHAGKRRIRRLRFFLAGPEIHIRAKPVFLQQNPLILFSHTGKLAAAKQLLRPYMPAVRRFKTA